MVSAGSLGSCEPNQTEACCGTRSTAAAKSGDKAGQTTAVTPALNQLFAIVVDEAFVRTGAHTQQCYVAPVHHDDIARVTPKRGKCTPIVAFDHEKIE